MQQIDFRGLSVPAHYSQSWVSKTAPVDGCRMHCGFVPEQSPITPKKNEEPKLPCIPVFWNHRADGGRLYNWSSKAWLQVSGSCAQYPQGISYSFTIAICKAMTLSSPSSFYTLYSESYCITAHGLWGEFRWSSLSVQYSIKHLSHSNPQYSTISGPWVILTFSREPNQNAG